MVGKQSHQFTYTLSETTGSHHCLLTNNTSSITLTTNELIGNLAVHATQDSSLPIPQDHHSVHGDNESNNEGQSNAVEQASEPPLIDFLSHAVLPSSTLQDHSISQFPQAEDQPILIPDEEEDASAPTEDIPEVYVDAVEAQPEDLEDNCHPSSFVSSLAENVDDEVEEVHMQPPPKFRWWRDCRLF